jgi:hypothetical protein
MERHIDCNQSLDRRPLHAQIAQRARKCGRTQPSDRYSLARGSLAVANAETGTRPHTGVVRHNYLDRISRLKVKTVDPCSRRAGEDCV